MARDEMTEHEAEAAFAELVRDQRSSALWFMRRDVAVSIAQPEAARVLESMERVADRASWLVIRRLKLWRQTHCS
jgi:hypothetical protein